MKKKLWLAAGILVALGVLAGAALFNSPYVRTIRMGRHQKVMAFIRNSQEHQDWVIEPGSKCREAPFIFPTRGFTGYLWNDSFKLLHPHQGIDIFSGTDVGVTPVIAAYDGYLTREEDWKSTVILRVPQDPLQPDRQIWLYYTHMADADGNLLIDAAFPPDSHEIPVKAGTLLGYQGNYSGNAGNPVGVHLHFSIVQDDGSGKYLNELDISNTLDPSPYLGLPLDGGQVSGQVPLCP